MLFRAIHSRSRRSRLRRHVRRAAECQKLASLVRALSAVVDDSGPVQHRTRACRTCPCVAHLASRAGLETAHGKSSPGPPPKPNHDIRLDVGEASAATALSSTLGMTPCPATRGSVRASPVSAGDTAGAGQRARTLCVGSSQRGGRSPPGRCSAVP